MEKSMKVEEKNEKGILTVDELGRIVIPIELRQRLGIFTYNKLEADDRGNNISLTKKEKNKKHDKRHSSYHRKKQRQHCQRY